MSIVAAAPAPAGGIPDGARGGLRRVRLWASTLVFATFLAGCAAPGVVPETDPGVVLAQLQEDLEPLLAAGDLDAALARVDAAVVRHPGVAELHAERALLLLEANDHERAAADLRQAARLAAQAGAPEQAEAYGSILSDVLEQPGDWIEQAAAEAEALPDSEAAFDALEFWDALRQEAMELAAEGDLAGAMDTLEQALNLAEDAFGPEHRLTVESILDLANVSFAMGDAAGAEALLMFALERSRTRPGPGHPWTLDIMASLADLFESAGRPDEALEVTLEAAGEALATQGAHAVDVIELEMLLAQRLEAVGDYAGGAERLEGTCARVSEHYGRHHVRTADCLEQYAILLGRGGDLEGAEDSFSEVLALRRALHGERHDKVLQTRLDLAILLQQQGAHSDAAAELDDLAGRVAPDGPLRWSVQEAQARTLLETGELERADRLAREVLDERMLAFGEDHPLTLDVLNLLGAIYQRTGNLSAAEDTWSAALSGYRQRYGVEHLATLTAMSNLGVVLEQQGAFDRAEPLLRTAMNASERMLGPAHPQTLNTMNNLALLYESQGRFNRAEPLYLLPIEVLSGTLGEAHPRTIAVRNNLAFLYMMEGDPRRAAAIFEDVHAAWVQALGAEHQDTLRGLNNLGRAYRGMGDFDLAAERIVEALALRRSVLGPRHPDSLRSQIDLGILERDRGDLAAAETELRAALQLAENVLGAEHPYTFEALNALADVLQDFGRLDAAFDLRRVGFERRTRFFDRMLWVTSDNAREGYLRLHRPELDRYLQLLPELDPHAAARELLDVSLQRKGLLLKVTSEIRQIASLGLDAQMVRLTEALTDAREELAALTLAGPGESDPEGHLARMRMLESRVADLQGELGRASLRYREAIAELSVDDLVDHLPEQGALVDFLVYQRPDGSQALLAGILQRGAGAAEPTFTLVHYDSMAPITSLVQEFRAIIQDVDALDEDVKDVGMEVFEALWAPLAAELSADGKVYLVPDGVLNVLPFDAIVDPADGRYLLETRDLHLLSSARDLVPSVVPPSTGSFLVFGGPDYDTEEAAGPEVLAEARRRSVARAALALDVNGHGTGNGAAVDETDDAFATGTRGSRAARFDAMRGVALADLDSRSAAELASLRAASRGLRGLSFSPLPGAELEGELIGRQIAEARESFVLYTGREAEEQVLNELDGPPRVLHMATHGFFLQADDELRQRLLRTERSLDVMVPPPGDNPLLRAGLAFAGVNSNAPFLGEIDTRNDGILTALEVLGLDLSGTELAVLSACDTGVGEIHEGEGVYGLRRAFQEAGVRQVVTSLWEVSDAGTQALMTAFYERMFAGMPPREAFREAQLELLESPRWGYPFIWSAFVLVGI
ncbi:MAG: CHAT domain-containing protein [Gammaproteobacteria bacterium]|nr:CHAT domain-containing protein [Gammaproteobacteria bacterium]